MIKKEPLMNNKNPIQNLIPILGMTIGVAIGIMIGFIFNDPELRANMLGRRDEQKVGRAKPATQNDSR